MTALCISTQHWLSELEILAMVFAAAIHDFEHTGTTNNFHIHTRYFRRQQPMWPRCSDSMWNQSSLLLVYRCLLAMWCPSNIIWRSYVLNFALLCILPSSLHTLHHLDGALVSQVRRGHSVQWQVRTGEPSRERCLQAHGGGGHEHICQLEQGWLEVRKKYIMHGLRLTVITEQIILTVFMDCFWQGAEDFGYRDGDVHWHVLSLPADQDHEECSHTDRQVRTENTAFQKSSHNMHQFWQKHWSYTFLSIISPNVFFGTAIPN